MGRPEVGGLRGAGPSAGGVRPGAGNECDTAPLGAWEDVGKRRRVAARGEAAREEGERLKELQEGRGAAEGGSFSQTAVRAAARSWGRPVPRGPTAVGGPELLVGSLPTQPC